MKFINTDGMVFIGSGSEWFWAALSGIVLASTFVAIYRQLRGQREQARHNTQLLRSQAHYNALVLENRPWEMLIDNEGLASIMTVGLATPEALSEGDWFRCRSHIYLQFNAWEYLYYQHRDGSIPKEMWVGSDAFYKSEVATRPGTRRFWDERQTAFDEPFHSYVAGEFAKRAASPTVA